MSKEKIRVYRMGDAYMLEKSNTLLALFLENIADFTALNPALDASYATAWQGLIDAAMAATSDSQVLGVQMDMTSEILVQMEKCRKKYNQIKYYVGEAFASSARKYGPIRLSKYKEVRQSQSNMILFMDDMWEDCTLHSAALIAVGMTQPLIDEIQTLRDELTTLNTAQEQHITKRPILTEDRIDVHNACYEKAMRIINAAQTIYYDDYARSRAFMFNPTGGNGGGEEDDSVIITAIVPNDGNAMEVFAVPYLPSRQIVVTNNGPEEIEIFIANFMDEPGTPMVVPNGMTETFTADMLGPDGDKIFARSMNSSGGETTIVLEIAIEE